MGHPILKFLVAQANRFQGDPYCPRCGNSLTFADATFWICGKDEACTIPLPVCSACESKTLIKKDSPVSTSALQAFTPNEWKQACIAALLETDKRKN